ncbi:MAG: hypothetical protein D6760_09655 [Deltaproteobacteria bacterium]|nr:MAG: hypothetical protein D6760_09655 [Deltaproteobacteria bacterium]
MAGHRVFVGVPREPLYSPGKVDADRAIFDATARVLERRGIDVRVVSTPRIRALEQPALVFAMCQGPAALAWLRAVESGGTRVVHSPSAIRACHRRRMAPLLARAGVPRPAARLVATTAVPEDLGDWIERRCFGVWIKRGDVHATADGDVVRVRSAADASRALGALAQRGVNEALVEEHVEGETVKFYGVRGTGFFRAYRLRAGRLTAAQTGEWPALCDRAAGALGLEIYGGDLIVARDGRTVLVDLNDWPSFSVCRDRAAGAIAERLIACSNPVEAQGETGT